MCSSHLRSQSTVADRVKLRDLTRVGTQISSSRNLHIGIPNSLSIPPPQPRLHRIPLPSQQPRAKYKKNKTTVNHAGEERMANGKRTLTPSPPFWLAFGSRSIE